MKTEVTVAAASGVLPLLAAATPAADGVPWYVTIAATVLGPPLSLLLVRLVSALWRVPVAMLKAYAKLRRKEGDEAVAALLESGASALEDAAKSAPTPMAMPAWKAKLPNKADSGKDS